MGKFLRFDNCYKSEIWSNLAYGGSAEEVEQGKSSKFNSKNGGQVKSSPAIHLVTKRGFYRLKYTGNAKMQFSQKAPIQIVWDRLPFSPIDICCMTPSSLTPQGSNFWGKI